MLSASLSVRAWPMIVHELPWRRTKKRDAGVESRIAAIACSRTERWSVVVFRYTGAPDGAEELGG